MNNLTEIANKIIPNNFRRTYIPPAPINFSTQNTFLSTKNTIIILMLRAAIITSVLNSAFRESKVVKAPGPAKSGKITGTMVADPVGLSILNNSHPKVISQAITKITNEPATANEETSTLNNLKIPSPVKRNAINVINEKKEAFDGLKVRFLFFKSIKIGNEPVTSIIANNTIKALTKSLMLNESIYIYIFLRQSASFNASTASLYLSLFITNCMFTCFNDWPKHSILIFLSLNARAARYRKPG